MSIAKTDRRKDMK